MKKDPIDLGRHPQAPPTKNGKPVPPIAIVLDNLMTEEGERLELLTRANPNLVKAAKVALFFSSQLLDDDGTTIGIGYAKKQIEQAMRFAVSLGGRGRQEQIDALNAGGHMPDSYYQQGGRGAQFVLDDESD